LVETLTFPELPYAPHSISGACPRLALVAGRNHFGRGEQRILESRMRFASGQPREIPSRKTVAPGTAPLRSQRALHSPVPHGPLLASPAPLAGPGLGTAALCRPGPRRLDDQHHSLRSALRRRNAGAERSRPPAPEVDSGVRSAVAALPVGAGGRYAGNEPGAPGQRAGC